MINPHQYESLTRGADTVKGWSTLGLKIPKALDEALAVWDAVQGYQIERLVPDLAALTPDSVGQAHKDLTATLMASGQFTQPAGPGVAPPNLSYAEVARQMLVQHAASTVVTVGRQSTQEILDQHKPAFDKAAKTYVKAVQALGLNPEDLSWAGLGKMRKSAEYEAVREAWASIGEASLFVNQAGNLGAHPTSERYEEYMHLVTPRDAGEYQKLDAASREHPVWLSRDPEHLFGPAGGPVYLAALSGIPLELKPLGEARNLGSRFKGQVDAELRRQMQAQRPRVWSPGAGNVAAGLRGQGAL